MSNSDDEAAAILGQLTKIGKLAEAIETGDIRQSLVAIRDYVVQELEGHRCKACAMSQLKTGDTASLVLRLTTILADIEALPAEENDEDPLMAIRARRG